MLVNNRPFLFLSLVYALLFSCDFPYSPEQMSQPGSSLQLNNSTNTQVTVFPIDGKRQTCNPSISRDTINFEGCMMWLNFSGELKVIVTNAISGFNRNANQHDRIIITDTSNTVKWYITIDYIAESTEEFQDPEWSSHPEYANFLVSSEYKKKWSAYAIHLLSKDTLKICDQKLNETSTPYLWVEKGTTSSHSEKITSTYDALTGFTDRESVKKYFGTYNVKFAYAKKENGVLCLYYIDYQNDSKPVRLNKPVANQNWDFESPIISPDGKWVVFNGYETIDSYNSYIQELSTLSEPILLEKGSSDPHWTTDPLNNLYIVYAMIPGANLVLGDLSDPSIIENGSCGKTMIQEVSCMSGLSSLFAFKKIDLARTIAMLPLKGGISPDGRFLCTASDKAFIVKIQ
jgi:hypothetical protein